MRVLTLDASTTAIGWAHFDLAQLAPDDLQEWGTIRPAGNLWERLRWGGDWLAGKMRGEHWIDRVALETPVVYMGGGRPRNAPSTIKVAYMVGVLGQVAECEGAEVMELRPDERLTAIGLPARCRNPKPQVVRLVNRIYGLELDELKDHDTADAIAMGWAVSKRILHEDGVR